MMKHLLKLMIVLFSVECMGFQVSAKHYSHKATRPAASDHTWEGYDYDFNLDENGNLTGTNTFSLVYNTTPPRWYNDGYGLVNPKFTYTGSETLTITVKSPGNRTYTFKTNVTEWEWDTHLLKWVKRRDMPYNGTRTVNIVDYCAEGSFEFPVAAGILDQWFVSGVGKNGMVPSGSKIVWELCAGNEFTTSDYAVVSEGASEIINVETYIHDVLHQESMPGVMTEGEHGNTFMEFRFPISSQYHDILRFCSASEGKTYNELEPYKYIYLPNVYYDNYVNPYAPVYTIEPNGHKRVTTLQPNGSKHYVETWTENGYDYTLRKEGIEEPIIGIKEEEDKTFIHFIGTTQEEERGYIKGNKYYMTSYNEKSVRDKYDKIEIDWTPLESDGYYVISDYDGNKYYTWDQVSDSTLTFAPFKFKSRYKPEIYFGGNHIFKRVDKEGNVTVRANNKQELSPQAQLFIERSVNPIFIRKFKFNYGKDLITLAKSINEKVYNQSWTYNKEQDLINGGFKFYSSAPIELITYQPDGRVKLPTNPYKIIPKDYMKDNMFELADNDDYFNGQTLSANDTALLKRIGENWGNYIMANNNKKFWDEVANQIGMELNVPDYDLTKVNAKQTGKRTEKMLKELCKLLTAKPASPDKWATTIAKVYGQDEEKPVQYKKAEISHIVKKGKEMWITISTTDINGNIKNATMHLKDNIPDDMYSTLWLPLAEALNK